MMFKPQLYKLSCPTFYMNTERLDYTDSIKYLGFTFSSDKKDYYGCFTVVQLYFVVTVLACIAHFCGLIIRILLTASLE